MLKTRVFSAIIMLILLFAAVLIHANIFLAAVYIMVLFGLYEYFTAIGTGIRPMKYIGILCGLIMLFLISNTGTQYLIMPFITIIILTLLSVPIFNNKYSFIGAGATIVGILYIPLLFGYLYLIRAIPESGVYLIWFVFIISWFSDTCAYFAGRFFGRTKLCPSVSPKKTVEGSIGGIAGSVIGAAAYGIILGKLSIVSIPAIHLLGLGILGSIISQIGDLAASSIKRNAGVKDYGKIIPGHGGILDRFDSILFVSPLIYYYIAYVIL